VLGCELLIGNANHVLQCHEELESTRLSNFNVHYPGTMCGVGYAGGITLRTIPDAEGSRSHHVSCLRTPPHYRENLYVCTESDPYDQSIKGSAWIPLQGSGLPHHRK